MYGWFKGKIILTGYRCPTTGLWLVHLSEPAPTPAVALCTTHSATPAERVAFMHAVLFSPVISTLLKALERLKMRGKPPPSYKTASLPFAGRKPYTLPQQTAVRGPRLVIPRAKPLELVRQGKPESSYRFLGAGIHGAKPKLKFTPLCV